MISQLTANISLESVFPLHRTGISNYFVSPVRDEAGHLWYVKLMIDTANDLSYRTKTACRGGECLSPPRLYQRPECLHKLKNGYIQFCLLG